MRCLGVALVWPRESCSVLACGGDSLVVGGAVDNKVGWSN